MWESSGGGRVTVQQYPLYHCEAAAEVVNLTVDEELLRRLRWLHVVKTAGAGAFVRDILAV